MKYNIYSNGKKINTIVADKEFCKKYCEKNSYTYDIIEEQTLDTTVIPTLTPTENEPTVEDMLNALVGGMSYE